jgi:hypothetical protein
MRKILSFVFVVFSLILLTKDSKSQVISFNTVTQGTGTVYGNNGQNGITFVIQNTNGFPAVLTEVGNYFTTSGTSNVELWFSSTSLSGAPGAVTSANGWTQIASGTATINNSTPFNATVGTYNSLFTGLTFTIPANTTYRFFLGSSITLEYTGITNPTGAIPVNFSNTGVNLQIGEHLIGGNFVGFGGPVTGPTFNPRAFTGGVTLNLLSTPCSGTPTAGISNATPTNPCPGSNVNLSLTGQTSAGNLSFQWLLSSTGNPGTWSPIAGATTAAYNYVPLAGSTNYFRCIVTCTNSSLFDTSVVVGPITTQPWSPTSPCYCGTSTATSNLYGDILNFTMSTLNNTTDCVNPLTGSQGIGVGTPSQRADFTSITAPIVYAGLNQSFSMTVGSCGTSLTHAAKIYIDYNHNSVFTDPGEEVYFSGATGFAVVPSTVLSGNISIPVINPGVVEPGLTRMRVIAQYNGQTTPTTITPCGSYTYGETEDYLVNIIPPSPYDPGVVAITAPSGNCFTATSLVTVQLRNYGSNPIDLSVNPVTVNLHVNGPNGLNTYNVTVSTGLLTPYGASGVTAIFSGPNAVNLYDGGIYSINTTLSISGLTNGNLFNDSLQTPVIKENYRPTPGAPYQLCQYSSIPFGQGLSVSGCSAPIFGVDSVIFTINPNIIDNVGATGTGTALNLPANCSNIYAGALGNAVLPTLPPGAYFTQPGELEVTNMSSSFRTEVRFILYGNAPVGPDLYAGCPTGYNTGANNLNIGGLSVGTAALFSNKRNITPAQLSAMYGGNGTVNLGYWETYNDNAAGSDVTFNVSGTTTAKLKFYYAYVPAGFNWYTVPSGPNPSLYNSTPFNPLVTTGSGISNSNTTGTYTFYAACSSSPTCRVPVQLQINPTPLAVQDTLSKCEYAVSSNAAIFDLTTMDASVSNNNVAASVEYYLDEPLFSQVPLPMDDTSSTNFIYSKVFYPATGCFSKDSLLLQVNSLPEFPSPVLTGFTCAPNSIDVANLIDPFSTTPSGTDTLYYEDPAYTIPHPNPHTVGVADTVYMVFATNTTPICSDTAVAYIDIIPANNYLSGQVLTPSIFSNAGSYSCVSTTLMDGMSDTIRTTTDCRRVASVTDVVNGTSLGTVSACLDIAPSTPFYNGQPYVNRAYTITPTTNDTGYVCLYYLDQDFQDYNADAFFTGWPLLPTAATMPANMQNVAVTKVSNGALGSLGSVPTAIPNSAINVSYDPATTVWTVCLPAEGFSHFYLHAQNPGNAPLPVTLLSFTGRSVKGSAELNWVTSIERNNSHFILERSREGKNFTPLSDKIASQAVNGNSDVALNYNYTDSKPFEGHNYYRLQQHDIDGNSSYSAVVNVYFGNETMVTVYPNPVHNLLTLEVNTPKATPAQVKITDATGRVVRVTDMQLQAGSNQTQIDLQSLAYGVYMLNISNGKGLNYSQSVRKN